MVSVDVDEPRTMRASEVIGVGPPAGDGPPLDGPTPDVPPPDVPPAAGLVAPPAAAGPFDVPDLAPSVLAAFLSVSPGVDPEDVHAELSEIVVGKKLGRASDDEIIVFDSTGVAIEDAVAAVAIYEKARASGAGTYFKFAA